MKTLISLLLIAVSALCLHADAFPPIPDSFWGIGPSIGYTGNAEYGGFTLGAEATHSFLYIFSASAGYRYVFSRSDQTPGLRSIHAEVAFALPVVIGFGVNYNWLRDLDKGIGLQAYFGMPIPLPAKFYMSVYYRPSWVRFSSGREIFHEWGLYVKFSNFIDKAEEAAQIKNRMRLDAIERMEQQQQTNQQPRD